MEKRCAMEKNYVLRRTKKFLQKKNWILQIEQQKVFTVKSLQSRLVENMKC